MIGGLPEAALWYAEHNWPVLPLYSVRDGACTCGNPRCSCPGKHPRTKSGLKDATTDTSLVAQWWRKWPDANVGIATGAAAGIVALDVDADKGGPETLDRLVRQHGAIPDTVEAMTGGGGRHLIFCHPGRVVRNRSGKLGQIRTPGLDIRGDGGYIVVAPSQHTSGRRYEWRDGHGPQQIKPAPLPQWLLDLIAGAPAAPSADPPDRRAAASAKTAGSEERAAKCLASLLRLSVADHADGSKRLFTAACRCVEHNLDDHQAIAVIRQYERTHPFPRTYSDTEMLQRLRDAERVAARGTACRAGRRRTRQVEQFRPFPVQALPEPAGSFVADASRAIGCDPSYVALPLLSALAAAIGNTRRVELKAGWSEPAIIWVAIIGESGTLKTPAFKLVVDPIRMRQGQSLKRHAEEMDQYEAEVLRYEKRLSEWKRKKDTSDEPPTKPQPPPAERLTVTDTTVEALAPILLANPRGLLLARDELAGWVGSFDRYTAGRGGADAANWLSMHNGESVVVDRKSGQPRTIYVPRASVSVTGGVQPGILDRVMGREHRESGLLARLLLAMPPRRPKQWSEAEISPAMEAAIATVFDRLYELHFDHTPDGDPRPVKVPLTPEGKAAWIEFYNEHATEQVELTGDLSAAWSKLEGYAARLALVTHFVRWAADDPTLHDPDAVDCIAPGI